MNWVEVADTAIKIGLGALIAGAFGYFTTRLSHDSDRRARYSRRRRDHLEAILTMLTDVENKYRLQKWRLETYRFYEKRGEHDNAKEEQRQFDELDEQLYLALDLFGRASSILLLLGESTADKLLWAYRDAVNEWVRWSVLDPNIFSDSHKEKLITDIKRAREKLFAALAESYKQS